MSKRKLKKSPNERAGHGVLCLEDSFIIIGGFNDECELTDAWKYTGHSWKVMKQEKKITPLPRLDFDGCKIGNSYYLFGGLVCEDESVSIYNDLWQCDFNLTKSSSQPLYTWTCVCQDSPVPERSGHIVVSIESNSFLVHGGECMKYFDDLWMFNCDASTWSQLCISGAKPCGRSGHAGVYCEDRAQLIVYGGVRKVDADVQYLNDLWVLDMSSTDSGLWNWSLIILNGIGPSPRDMPALLYLQSGELLLRGGYGLAERSDVSTCDSDDDGNDDEVTLANDDARADEVTLANDAPSANEDSLANVATLASNEFTPEFTSNDFNPRPDVNNTSEEEQTIHFEPQFSSSLDVIADDDNSSDEGISVDYLNDLWIINLNTKSAVEIDEENSEEIFGRTLDPLPPLRGTKLCRTQTKIVGFGGFDGSKFHGISELPLPLVKLIV